MLKLLIFQLNVECTEKVAPDGADFRKIRLMLRRIDNTQNVGNKRAAAIFSAKVQRI